MALKQHKLIALQIAVFLLSVWVLFAAVFYLDRSPPKINGVVIPQAQSLKNFSLVSHQNTMYNNQSLLGNWHILSYGYTDCPDICPTTLALLAQVEKKVIASEEYTDLDILFYTIDPQRDTVQKLAQYIPFFSSRFIGLTPSLQSNSYIDFEQSLGIQGVLTPLPAGNTNFKGYSVSHGVMLYVLNAEGKLQAILKPDVNKQGIHSFDSEKIYQDYRALRHYFPNAI
jgi:protein SCO1/2